MNPVAGDRCDVFHLDPVKVTALKKKLLSEASVGALAETFKLLGDTTRVRILDALSRSELCVCDIAGLLGLGESAVSHQLRLLRGMRLVRSRRAGRMVFYTLDDQHIVGLFEHGLEHVEERARAGDLRARSGPTQRSAPPHVRGASAAAHVRAGAAPTNVDAGADSRGRPGAARTNVGAGADLRVRPRARRA